VIAQVRISAVVSVGKFVPEIQEQLRHRGFPRFKRNETREFLLTPGAEPKITTVERFEFQDKESRSGIILASDFVALHATRYDVYEQFAETLATALEIVHRVMNISLVERIGLRYVDLVRVGVRESLSDYLRSGLLGLDPSELGVSKALSRFEFVGLSEVGKLVVRCYNQEPGTLLPPDLTPGTLRQDVEIDPEDLPYLLDFDHYSEESQDFNVGAVLEIMGRLNDNLDRAFRAAVTEGALVKWGRQDVEEAQTS
jgi:uncharacterized protein (TIGR04255 family)